jgi:hypothetical protein
MKNKILWRLLGALLLLLIISCQSSAPTVGSAASIDKNGLPLEKGASAYIIANVKEARPIIDKLPIKELEDKNTKQMLDKTEYIAAAVFPLILQQNKMKYQLVGWGNYPSSQAASALSFNSQWKTQKAAAGYSYWYSQANGFSITLNKKQLFLAASANDLPAAPITTTPLPLPEGFIEFREAYKRGTFISCWFESPGAMLNQMLNSNGIPLRVPAEKFYVNVLSGYNHIARQSYYEAVLRIQFDNALQARAIATALTLAINTLLPEGSVADNALISILLANPPALDGRNLDIQTAQLSEEELTLLLNLFLLYWK